MSATRMPPALPRSLIYAGMAWPFLHSLFLDHRGFPFDGIFVFDVALVISPPILAQMLARKLRELST